MHLSIIFSSYFIPALRQNACILPFFYPLSSTIVYDKFRKLNPSIQKTQEVHKKTGARISTAPVYNLIIHKILFYFTGANLDLSCPSGLGVISPAFVNAIFVSIGPTSS